MTSHRRIPLQRPLERLYRALLLAYPRAFRDHHGEEMQVESAELLVERYHQHGWPGLIRCAGAMLFDTLVTGLRERRRSRARQRVLAYRPHGSGSLTQDIRFAVRSLRRRRGFAALAIGTLALGIGATTAIFSVVDTVLLRPLPYDRPGQLVNVWNTYPGWRGHEILHQYWDRIWLSYPEYEDWRDQQTLFEGVGLYGATRMALTGAGDPVEVRIGSATASLFPLLGIRPAAGRVFLPGDDGRTAKRIALLDYGFWQTRFGGDAEVIDRSIVLDGTPYTVVGVLPHGFQLRSVTSQRRQTPHELWIPIGARGESMDNRGERNFEALARLNTDVTVEQSLTQTQALLSGGASADSRGVRVVPRKVEEIGNARGPLLLLLGAVGLLVLIACGNVATLMLGEAGARRHELATRAALGAGRGRIIRLLLTESFVLGALGTAIGLVIAAVGIRLLVQYAPPSLPLPPDVRLDARVLAFSALLGVATGMIFGLAPAVLTSAANLQVDLRQGSPGSGGRSRGWRAQHAVIAGQVALSLVLLVSAGLLTRSLTALFDVDPGFRADRLAVVRLSLPLDRYATRARRLTFFERAAEELTAIPGVSGVTGSSTVPFSGGSSSLSFDIEGREVPEDEKKPEAERRTVLPNFHQVLGIPLLAGRALSERDRTDAQPVVVISESMARRFWPTESPIGARIVWGRRAWGVVGIVADVQHNTLGEEVKSTFYVPFAQQIQLGHTLLVRTSIASDDVLPQVRDRIRSLDALLPINVDGTMQQLIAQSTAEERYRTFLLAVFGLCATALAAVGIFGVTARGVTQRSHELGVRLALGARQTGLVRMVLRQEMIALVIGAVAGLLAAVAASNFLERFLFTVDSRDPLTFVVATGFLVTLGLLASYLPARRIAKLDPTRVLRAE